MGGKRRYRLVLASAALAMISPHFAAAHEVKAAALKIIHPWVRATPKGISLTAGYARIRNTGKVADRLLSATLIRAKSAEVHQTTVENDVARMRAVAGGIEIKPGETVELKPGGLHLMFIGLDESLIEHSYVAGTMTFAKAGTIKVEFAVEAPAPGADPGKDHEH